MKNVLCHSTSTLQQYLLSSGFSLISFQNKDLSTVKNWRQEEMAALMGNLQSMEEPLQGAQAASESNSQGAPAAMGLVLVHPRYRTHPWYLCRGFGGALGAVGSCCLVRDAAGAVCPAGGGVDRRSQR